MISRFITLAILLLFYGSNNFGMEYGQDNICQQLAEISPDASRSEYEKLAQSLQQHNKSACSCVKELLHKRFVQAKKALEQEWKISDQHWQDINDFNAKTAAHDSSDGEIIIKSKTNLSKPLRDDIIAQFKMVGRENVTVNVELDNDSDLDGVNRFLTHSGDPIDFSKNRIKPENIYSGEFQLGLCHNFDRSSAKGKKGLLLHEINGHVLYSDHVSEKLLWLTARIHKPQLEKNPFSFYNSKSFIQYTKAVESRADQIPAACTMTENARFLEACLNELKRRSDGRNMRDDSHDPIENRYMMAVRIRKLKEAEEQLNQNKKS